MSDRGFGHSLSPRVFVCRGWVEGVLQQMTERPSREFQESARERVAAFPISPVDVMAGLHTVMPT